MQGEMKATEKAILHFITGYITKNKYPPTYAEIADGMGYSSKATVHRHMQNMFNKGILETDSETTASRAIRIPGMEFVPVIDFDKLTANQ